jgi:hypothetical protein
MASRSCLENVYVDFGARINGGLRLKKIMNRLTWKVVVAATLVMMSLVSANHAQNKRPQRIWPDVQSHCNDHPPTLPQDPTTWTRFRRFDSIWRMRKQKNVVSEILPFLRDPFPTLRVRAVRALGELENPAALPPLQALLERMKVEGNEYKEEGIPVVTLKLALGRITSHNIKGKSKISTVLKSVGLTWSEFLQLSQNVNGPRRSSPIDAGTPGYEIVQTIVDLLYTMGKQGEKVEVLAKEVTLTPAQRVIVKVANLPENQEIKLILDSLSSVYVVRNDDAALSQHLVELGPSATLAILRRLEDMKQHPKKYSGLEPVPNYPGAFQQHMGYVNLFNAAIQTRDRRMIPLLSYFGQNPQEDIRKEAITARQLIESSIAIQ